MNTTYNYIIYILSQNSISNENPFSNESEQACVFTSNDPSNLILLFDKSFSKSTMKSNLKTYDDLKNFYSKSEGVFFNFDEVYDLSKHQVEVFYSKNFQMEYIPTSSLFLFNSYEDKSFINPLFSECLLSFVKKTTSMINEINTSKYGLMVTAFIIYNKTLIELLSKKSESIETTLELLTEINTKKTNTIKELNCDENEINLFIKITFENGIEFYFGNAMNTFLTDNIEYLNDSPNKKMQEFLNEIATINDKTKQDYFNIDKIEKIHIITCVDETLENYKKTLFKLKMMHYLSKETKNILTQSIQVSHLDSIISSNEDNNMNYNSSSLSNSFNQKNKLKNSINRSMKNSLNFIHATNQLNNETIEIPEASLMVTINENTTNNDDMFKSINNLYDSVNRKGNDQQMIEMVKMLDKINFSIEKRDNEEIEKLKEDLHNAQNIKEDIESKLNKQKSNLDLKLEENFALNKKLQQKENNIAYLEKKINETKVLNEKEMQQIKNEIMKSSYENKDLKNKLNVYESKYQQLKANNELMKKRLDNIQNKINMFNQKKTFKK